LGSFSQAIFEDPDGADDYQKIISEAADCFNYLSYITLLATSKYQTRKED